MAMRKALIMVVLNVAAITQSSNPWNRFVSTPSKITFEECQGQIRHTLSQSSGPETTITYIQVSALQTKFLSLVSRGNISAADLCLQLRPIFRGFVDQLELFDQALGRFLKRKPKAFLRLLQEFVEQDDKRMFEIGGMLGNYGDEFLGGLDQQIEETKERIRAIKSTPKEYYPAIRAKCLDTLERILDNLNVANREKH